MASDLATFPVSFARAFGGDFIGPDLKLVPDPAAMEKALATLADLFKAGALPRTFATTSNDDQVTWLQQGRAAFTVLPFARYAQLNRQDQSKYPGTHQGDRVPDLGGAEGQGADGVVRRVLGDVHPATMRATRTSPGASSTTMSSKAVTLGAARNGNGPVRVSTFADPGFAAAQPLAAVEAKALRERARAAAGLSRTRRARRRCSSRRCSSPCSAARRRRRPSPRSRSGSRR